MFLVFWKRKVKKTEHLLYLLCVNCQSLENRILEETLEEIVVASAWLTYKVLILIVSLEFTLENLNSSECEFQL